MTLPPRSRISPGLTGGHVLARRRRRCRISKPGRGRPTVVATVSTSSSGRGAARRTGLGQPVAGDQHRRTAARRGPGAPARTGMSAAPVTATRRLDRSSCSAVGVVEDRLVERRRAGKHGHPLGGDPGQHPVDVEHRLGQHRGTAGDAGEDPCLQAEHVEVRVDHQVAVVGGRGPVIATQSVATQQRPRRGSSRRPWARRWCRR